MISFDKMKPVNAQFFFIRTVKLLRNYVSIYRLIIQGFTE